MAREVVARASIAPGTLPYRGGPDADRFHGSRAEAVVPVLEDFFHGRAGQAGAILPDQLDRAIASLPRGRAVADPIMTIEETPVPACSMRLPGARFRAILPLRGDALALLTPQLPSGLAGAANVTRPNLPGRPIVPGLKTATR